MTRDDLLLRLALLRPELTNVIGFHALLDGGCAKTPLDAALHQVDTSKYPRIWAEPCVVMAS